MLFGCVARRQAAADQQTIQRIGLSEGADAFHYSHGGRNQPKRYVLFKTARLSHYYTRQTPCWEGPPPQGGGSLLTRSQPLILPN